MAEKLARKGCRVRLAVNGMHAEKNRQPYLRYDWVGILVKLNVEVIPYIKLYGADKDTAYLMHTFTKLSRHS
ncbi:MAG: hypothetical protein OES26_16195 [Gammaproteobacteria bacterium]|nr:hypothetical protein [Gammaproteobacteria bacterium]